MGREELSQQRPVHWIGSAKRDYDKFPETVQDDAGYDLWQVQLGKCPSSAKPMKGLGGTDVLELTEPFDSDTYRVICTVRFKLAIYVLHAFQKKSKQGIKTSRKDMDVIKARLYAAAEDYARRYPDD